jgi:hypothetical protein
LVTLFHTNRPGQPEDPKTKPGKIGRGYRNAKETGKAFFQTDASTLSEVKLRRIDRLEFSDHSSSARFLGSFSIESQL